MKINMGKYPTNISFCSTKYLYSQRRQRATAFFTGHNIFFSAALYVFFCSTQFLC